MSSASQTIGECIGGDVDRAYVQIIRRRYLTRRNLCGGLTNERPYRDAILRKSCFERAASYEQVVGTDFPAADRSDTLN